MQVSFAGEAYESFQAVIESIRSYGVLVTPEDGSEPFDAVVIGSVPDAEWGDTIEVVRVKDDDFLVREPRERIRVNAIHVY